MSPALRLVVFTIDERRYALKLETVERIVRVVDIDPLPKAPGIVLGVVNVRGTIMPVVNVRKRFNVPERELELSDELILARAGPRALALVVDAVIGVVELSESEATPAAAILPGLAYVEGVARLEGGLTFIHDLNTFLSLEEARALEAAMPLQGDEP
ncbi:MAG TPA: chemotaxis protein CheW [Candidatus Didemnitutus sp.]